ncbi:MAG TPA: DNA double-strand break repair nuclease NurA [Acidimicrobiales bacterium]|nr:DNA double-strand break repair nuclease NurA [Acidimicrobiales bacterium]
MSFAVDETAAGLDPIRPPRLSQAGPTLGVVDVPAPSSHDGLTAVAARLASLLLAGDRTVSAGETTELDFEAELVARPLGGPVAPAETWAVDGGQALVADARCLQVYLTRAARVCFRGGACVAEDDAPARAHLLGADHGRPAALAAGLDPGDGVAVDVNLLRDWDEWQALRTCVDDAAAGTLVLVDGDLVPDWRLEASLAGRIFAAAAARGITVAGVTKHSSLACGGAPLVARLESEAARLLGERTRWWAPVARTRAGSRWPELQVVVARLDPDARYAFRVDLPAATDPEWALRLVAAVADDAGFPGYPYPLSVADRLAACPGWLRHEAAASLDEALERAGVPPEVRERAFDDRHRLMERA